MIDFDDELEAHEAQQFFGGAPVTIRYQWTRGGVDIPGATGKSYQIQEADRGHAIRRNTIMSNALGQITKTRIIPIEARAIEFKCPACGAAVGVRCIEPKKSSNPHGYKWRKARQPHDGRIAKAGLIYG